MTKELILSQGKVTIVDDDVYEWASQFKWCVLVDTKTFYASRGTWSGNPRKHGLLLLHREIMDAPSDMTVDHINGDGLDNQRINLRLATPTQNFHNRGINSNNRSGYKGVNWDKTNKKWVSRIGVNWKRIHLGNFDTPEEAARAYDKAALEHFGEFARLNFPDSQP